MAISGADSTSRITKRSALVSQAFQLEYATLAWMIIEAAVAIGSGVAAGSLLLIAFGVIVSLNSLGNRSDLAP